MLIDQKETIIITEKKFNDILENSIENSNLKYLSKDFKDRFKIEIFKNDEVNNSINFNNSSMNSSINSINPNLLKGKIINIKKDTFEFKFNYTIESPLDIFFTKEIMKNVYSEIFKILFNLKNVEFQLNNTWLLFIKISKFLESKKKFEKFENINNLIKIINIMRGEMINRVSYILYFFMYEIIENCFLKFQEKIKIESKDIELDELIFYHNEYLQFLYECFVKDSSIKFKLNFITQNILKFIMNEKIIYNFIIDIIEKDFNVKQIDFDFFVKKFVKIRIEFISYILDFNNQLLKNDKFSQFKLK
jgi:hypothetical protein